jgi:hypothetical protein
MDFPVPQILNFVEENIKGGLSFVTEPVLEQSQNFFERHSAVQGGFERGIKHGCAGYSGIQKRLDRMVNQDGFSDSPGTHKDDRAIDRTVPDEPDQGIEVKPPLKSGIIAVDPGAFYPPGIVELEPMEDLFFRNRQHLFISFSGKLIKIRGLILINFRPNVKGFRFFSSPFGTIQGGQADRVFRNSKGTMTAPPEIRKKSCLLDPPPGLYPKIERSLKGFKNLKPRISFYQSLLKNFPFPHVKKADRAGPSKSLSS